MRKINLDNFFRRDLNLKNKWWHRLFSVVFILSSALFVTYNIVVFSAWDMFRGGDVQQWEKVESLSERITSEIKPIKTLIKTGEKIGENERTYVLNDKQDAYYNGTINDVYCSTELSSNYEKVKNMRKVDELYIGGSFNRTKVSPDEFVNYIKQNDISCLVVDGYTNYDADGNEIGKLTFLEPSKSYQENWSFFEKSTFKTVLYYFEMIPIVFAYSFLFLIGCLFVYYQIFIYIIFGKKEF